MKETKIINLLQLEQSPKEVIVLYREWLLGGETFNWEYRIEPWGDNIILFRW